MILRTLLVTILLVILCQGPSRLRAGDGQSAVHQWLDPDGISGKLVIVGGGGIPDEALQQFVQWAGGAESRLVVITTADARAGDETFHQHIGQQWQQRTGGTVSVLHVATREQCTTDHELPALLESATAIWFEGGQQSRIAERYLGTPVESHVAAVLQRGGTIGGTSAGAAIMSRVMIAGGNPVPELAVGFDLLPDAIVDQHFGERQREARLAQSLALHPTCFGVGIDENTALLVQGREMRVMGRGSVTFATAATRMHSARIWVAPAGSRADLTAWRRAARQTHAPPFPPIHPRSPEVAHGSLVIVGGGRLPPEITRRFIELAGGPDAPIVVLPTANPDPLPSDEQMVAVFSHLGARDVTVLRERRGEQLETPAVLEVLRGARGIWFGGGRQWRFVDAYEGTSALPLFHQVLQRGGVIGGTSAGASIQAEYLVRGNPLGNTDMMAAGYERGLGFLPGVAIDQHFAQRHRFADLLSVVHRHPQLVGIGIDEGTALIVSGSRAEVMGDGAVHFCGNGIGETSGNGSLWTHVPAGSCFDFARRQELE